MKKECLEIQKGFLRDWGEVKVQARYITQQKNINLAKICYLNISFRIKCLDLKF